MRNIEGCPRSAPLRLRAFAPLIFTIVLGTGLPAGAGDAENTAAMEAAVKAYENGQPGKALDICVEGLNNNPGDRELYLYAVGILPENPSKHLDALRAATARARVGDDYIYPLGLCKIYRNSGRLAEALSSCKRALELEPTVWPVYGELGLTYSRIGKPGKALETLSQGVELFPGNYKAYYYLAAEHERSSGRRPAMENYLKALELAGKLSDFDARTYSGIISEKVKKLPALKTPPPQRAPQKTAVPAPPRPQAPAEAQRETLDACVLNARKLRQENNPAAAEKKLSACAGMAPRNPEVRLERAELLTQLGRHGASIEEYQRTAALFGKQDASAGEGDGDRAMAAFCHIKTAQAWSKLGDLEKAARYYEKALETNRNDLNATLELAGVYEARGDPVAAAGLYERVLNAEPANPKAGERLDEINFSLLSNAELLSELKGRKIADAGRSAPSAEDLKTLGLMRRAEKDGATDFLKSRAPSLAGLMVTGQVRGRVKLMLTMAGFKAYQGYLTRDAVGFFEKKGVALRDVFALRDLKGRPIFDPAGRLTGEGLDAYARARTGSKSWLMPYETVPSAPEEETANRETAQALKEGYREISDPEFSWLLRATECPVETLTEKPGEILRLIKTPKYQRYFLCYEQGSVCAMKGTLKLSLYIENYRRGDTRIPEIKATAFFGSKATGGRRFCHNGKIWAGE